MSNGNPFYVHPGADFGPGLMGLAGTVSKVGEIKKEERRVRDEKDRIVGVQQEIQAAVESGDADKIRQIMMQNPEMATGISQALNVKFPGGSADVYKNALRTTALDPSQVRQAIADMTEQFKKDRIDAQEQELIDKLTTMANTETLEKLQKGAEAAYSLVADKDEWDRYKDLTGGDKPLSPAGKVQSDIDKGLLTEEQAKDKGSEQQYAPTKLTKLFTKLDTFKPGSKRREYYQKAIDKETSGGNPDVDLILAQRIVDEKLDFNKLSRRGGQKGRIASVIAQIAPDFDLIAADANIKYKTDSANLRSIALIAGIEPLFEELSGQAAALSNSVIPIFNKGVNAWKLATGEAKIVAFNNLRDDVIAETERILLGSGVLSDSKYLRALGNLNTAQSPAQMGAAIQQMMLVVQKRDEALRAQPYPQKTSEPETPKEITTQEEYDLLPPGTIYLENGKRYRK